MAGKPRQPYNLTVQLYAVYTQHWQGNERKQQINNQKGHSSLQKHHNIMVMQRLSAIGDFCNKQVLVVLFVDSFNGYLYLLYWYFSLIQPYHNNENVPQQEN